MSGAEEGFEQRAWRIRQEALEERMRRQAYGDRGDEIAESAQRAMDELEIIVKHGESMSGMMQDWKVAKDQASHERATLVALLARLYPSGVRPTEIEGRDPEWNHCCYIDLPTGQIRFHYHDDDAHLFQGLPPYTKPYDGHDKTVALKRIRDAFGYDLLSTANLIGN